jgi:hypothetical protein
MDEKPASMRASPMPGFMHLPPGTPQTGPRLPREIALISQSSDNGYPEIFSICDARHTALARMRPPSSAGYFAFGSDVMLRETDLRPQPSKWTSEPSLFELLSDPIAQALMVADGVKCGDLDTLFANVQGREHPGKQ